MTIYKLAAIDIGSNAIRLLISNVIEKDKFTKPFFSKNSLVRVPIRLGEDTFGSGSINKKNILRIVKAIKSFKYIMEINEVDDYIACATSALREAKNGKQVVERIFNETNIKIELIDGKREAELIALTDLENFFNPKKTYLHVDVGGGSTELTLINGKKIIDSKSFKIGTVRILKKMVSSNEWNFFEKWIVNKTKKCRGISLIGSGGTINKIFKISGKKIGKPLSYIFLCKQYEKLKKQSFEELIINHQMNPDRADVIVQAVNVYLLAMRLSGSNKIYVPKIGLADGSIKLLYLRNKKKGIS